MRINQVARWAGCLLLGLSLFATVSATAQAEPPAPAGPAVVLYDQTLNIGSNFVDSSDWGSRYSSLISQAADDFIVPTSAIWKVTSVIASGAIVQSDGPGVLSLLVQFYSNSSSSAPATLLYSQTVPSGSISGLATGVFDVTLASQLTLGPGHYWLSVQARQDCPAGTSGNCKHWVWTESSVKSSLESDWQNPPNGFGSGCTTWKPRITVCHQPSDSTSPDLLFKLSGTSIPVASHLFLPVIYR